LRQIGVTFSGLITSLVIAREWGPEGVGWFFIFHFLPNIAFITSAAGLSSAITYSLSSKSNGHEELISWALVRMPLVLLMQVVFISVYILKFSDLNISNFKIIAGMMTLLAAANTIKEFTLAILQSKKDIIRYNKCLAIESLSVLTLLAIFTALGLPMLSSIFSSLIFGSALGFLPPTIRIFKSIYWPRGAKKSQWDTINFALKSYPSSLLAFLNNRFSIIFITVFFSIEALGVFSIALMLSEKLLTLARIVSISIFPRIAEKSSSASIHTPMVAGVVFWTTGMATASLFAITNPLIMYIYGESFDGAINFVYLLASVMPFFAVSRIIAQDFAGRGRPELNAITSALALTTNIILCFFLYDDFGLLAVVIAFACSMLTNTVLKIIIWCRLNKQPATNLFLLNMGTIRSYFT